MSNIMNRFMIGQFGNFNRAKYVRDLRTHFFGVEACLIESKEDIQCLLQQLSKDGLSFSVHFPLRTKQWKYRDPQYLSQDEKQREDSYEFLNSELEYIAKLNPSYVLLHYPKPVILDDRVDWSNWRFADKTEYYYESQYTYKEFEDRSRAFFQWISEKAKELNFLIVLELDGVNQYIYDTDLLEELLLKYNNIKLCLDVGRLHLQEKLDVNFDSFSFTKRFSKFAEVVHLWNVKISSNLEHSHFPILPGQDPEEGWANVEKYISIIKENNKTCKFLFEHQSDKISDEELEQCYRFIEKLLL